MTSGHAEYFHIVWPRMIEFGRRGSVRGSHVCIGWSKKKELMPQTKGSMIFGQYPSTWSVRSCG